MEAWTLKLKVSIYLIFAIAGRDMCGSFDHWWSEEFRNLPQISHFFDLGERMSFCLGIAYHFAELLVMDNRNPTL